MSAAAPPLALSNVGFGFPGNPGSVPLRDPASLAFLGDQPEWSAQGRSVPAAFVAGSRPAVRVVFRRAPEAPPAGSLLISAIAEGAGPGIPSQPVAPVFDSNGLAAPVDLRLDGEVPRLIGPLELAWDWRVESDAGAVPLGRTSHSWLVTRNQPIQPAVWAWPDEPRDGPAGDPDARWVYLPIMQWTCEWAAGLDDEKAICDAILARLPESGLQYAVPAHRVHDMLLHGGGYCAGWYRMLQAMAGAQGVLLERRTYAVDWRPEAGERIRWCAIVVEHPGLNRKEPAEGASTFHDVNQPPLETSPIHTSRLRRYRFWGSPGRMADGHCINFLRYRDGWYLYDACFRDRPVALENFELPDPDPRHPKSVEGLGNFKEAYLDGAVGYMLGSVDHGGVLCATTFPDAKDPKLRTATVENGLTVRTAILPERDRWITFYWDT